MISIFNASVFRQDLLLDGLISPSRNQPDEEHLCFPPTIPLQIRDIFKIPICQKHLKVKNDKGTNLSREARVFVFAIVQNVLAACILHLHHRCFIS